MIYFLLVSLGGFAAGKTLYSYIDGNNNAYLISQDSLTYDPITPRESSSGTYSGGEPKQVALTVSQFQKIEALIKAIQKDKSLHEPTRQMGFGTLIIGKKSIFLHMNSAQKKELEELLKACLE